MDDEPMSEQETQARTSMDSALSVLADRNRRRVLVSLLDIGPQSRTRPLDLQDVLRSGEASGSCEIRMRHVHLPKLADKGYIEWDRTTDEIRQGQRFAELRPLVRLLVENEGELLGDVI